MRFRCLLAWILGTVLAAGCGPLASDPDDDVWTKPKLRVTTAVLDTYVGTYRLPSGAPFPVARDGQRLLGGTPARELLAQTTRQFRSNHLPGEFHFERSADGAVVALRQRLAKHDSVCPRIDPSITADPTRRVAAGGHQLRLLITGSGSPTIVLEDGIGNGIDLQSVLQADLAKLSTTVTYDHAGTGGSDPGPLPRDARRVAQELRVALGSAGLRPPFVLIGGSIGADYIRIFAHAYPDDTAGLILLDPTPDWDRLTQWAAVHAPARVETYGQLVRDATAVMDRLMSVQEAGRRAEWAVVESTRALARQAFPLPEIPIVQITGAGGRRTVPAVDDKVRFFDAWLREHLPQAKHVLAPHSAHAVALTDRRLVIDEVSQLLADLRSQRAKPVE